MADEWLPKIDRRGHAVYLDIVEVLENDIRSGRLSPGSRLPSHRALAQHLGVALGTVTQAYREALRRGLVFSSGKKGTFVGQTSQIPQDLIDARPPSLDTIDLSYNYPAPAEDPDPSEALRQMASYAHNRHLLGYTTVGGFLRHREAGVQWVKSFGLEVAPDQLIPTQGAQHAMTGVMAAICTPGDTVASDRYTFCGVKHACRLLNLNLVGISSDDNGVNPDDLEQVCQEYKPKVIYLVPTLNNPTTTILPLERREAIAGIADRYGIYIIEDEIYRPLVSNPPPPLTGMLPEKCFHIASASKVVAGGLRVAYVVPPASMMNALTDTLCSMSMMVSPLTLELFSRWIADGTVSKIIEGRRKDAVMRQDLAEAVLAGAGSFAKSPSYNIWLRLPDDWTAVQFASEAQRRGVLISPADSFHVGDGVADPALRVCLAAAADHDRLRKGLTVLSDILRGVPRRDQFAL